MLNKENKLESEELVEKIREAFFTRQPPKSFLAEYDFIHYREENLKDPFLLCFRPSNSLYIEKDDIYKLPSFFEDLKMSKTKAEIRIEKIELKILNMIASAKKDLFVKIKEKASFFGLEPQILEKNTKLLRRGLTKKIVELQSERLGSLSKKEIYEECESLLDDLCFDSILLKIIPPQGFDLSRLEKLETTPSLLFSYFLTQIVIIHKRRLMGEFESSTSIDLIVNNENIKINIDAKYNTKMLKKKTNEELLNFDPLALEKLSSLKIEQQFIDDFIKNIFNELTDDIVLLENDKLLKESIFQNFKGKIEAVKKKRVNLSFEIKNDETLKISDIKKSILNVVLEVKERRLAGFKRSFNRKTIQSKIEIEAFKDLFPFARDRKRELVYIQGETNSGKTYTAFEMAKEYGSGVYAAPLRLLALEGQQELQKRGIKCSMITGEERDDVEGATFTSSTVEMMDYTQQYDVAIIDEVQLINDPDRGHAWLEAIIGINAEKVILVGSKDIESVIVEIAEYLNEPLEIKKFERKTKLSFQKDLFNDFMKNDGKLPPNSAVIAFSKKEVLKLKEKFEKLGNNVSVIYGALPPQVRRMETERFVNGETDVVIGTDAIGLGLNLPIEYLFFSKAEKFNGRKVTALDAALVKQIVGRSGRFNKFDVGYVSALSKEVFSFIEKEFKKDTTIKTKELKCSPNHAIINQIQQLTNESSIHKLLQNYNNSIKFDFDIENHMNEYAYMIAMFIDEITDNRSEHLSLHEKVKLVNAPVSMDRSFKVMDFYKKCIDNIFTLREDLSVHPLSLVYERLDSLSTETQNRTELSIKKIDLLSWLSFNFEEFECLKSDIENKRKELNKELISYLRGKKQ